MNVLQDWVGERMTFRQQGVLILALRGPDGVRKEDAAKPLVRTLRGLAMNSGRERRPMAAEGVIWRNDTFMNTLHIANEELWQQVVADFFDQFDAYNVHFLQHLAHAFAVVGIHHPNHAIAARCWAFYERFCHKLHMGAETPEQLVHRLRDGVREEEDN